MPSLKDLRNRIASVKATRKITKAMQMVAAAKLRRAQEAATAARPFAERMDRLLANLNRRANKENAPRLLVGTGKDDVYLLIVMTAERELCGGFNSNIAKLARQDAQRLLAAGKTVKILTDRSQGRRQSAPILWSPDRRSRRLARPQADRLRRRHRYRRQGPGDVPSRRV